MDGDQADELADTPRTGHDLHFLERLERVSATQVELALSLYQDPELVRHILNQIKLPEGAPRVAITLGDDEPAPHAIVARDGAFVTCLGIGMSVGACPVIPWERVAAISDRFRELRERMRDYDRRSKRTRSGQLFSKVVTAGDGMSREEFIALSAWAPISQGVFLRELVEALKQLDEVGRALGHLSHPRPRDRDVLEAYWQAFWAIGHWTLLLGIDGRELYERMGNDALAEIVSSPAFTLRYVALAIRGLWAVGKIGKPLVGAMRRALPKATTSDRISELMIGLSVIAARNTKLRSEVDKGLAFRAFGGPPDVAANLADYANGVAGAMHHVFDQADEMVGAWRTVGVLRVDDEVERLPEAHPLRVRFASEDDVSDDIAFAAAAEHDGDPFNQETDAHAHLLMAVPWLARAQAEDFYFPESYLRAIGTRRFDPERAMRLVQRRQMLVGRGETVRRDTPRPGRNDPCPCGSGKKYKRCHGA
jgi:hypothetical protein